MATTDLTKEAFNSKQVCEIIGITYRQLATWDKQGIVKPSIRPATGRGSQRLYSYRDMLSLKTVKSLRGDKVSLQKIRKCVSYLRRHLRDVSHPLHVCTLISAGNTVYLATDEETLIDTVKQPGQYAYRSFIDIAAFDRELRKAVFNLTRKRIEEVDVGDYTYQVEIEPDLESGGYVAEVAGLPGCMTQGDTLDEVMKMAADAIETYLEAVEDLKDRGVVLPIKRRRSRRKAPA